MTLLLGKVCFLSFLTVSVLLGILTEIEINQNFLFSLWLVSVDKNRVAKPLARAEKPFQGLVLNHYRTDTRLKMYIGRQDHTVIPHYHCFRYLSKTLKVKLSKECLFESQKHIH